MILYALDSVFSCYINIHVQPFVYACHIKQVMVKKQCVFCNAGSPQEDMNGPRVQCKKLEKEIVMIISYELTSFLIGQHR